LRPKDGRPLSGGTDYQIDVDLAAIAEEITASIKRPARSDTSTKVAPPRIKKEFSDSIFVENFIPRPLSPSELRQKLIASFNDSELHDLSFDLGVDYESVAGSTRDAKARELITYLQRRNRLDELISLCRARRPSVSWGI
jgi:hypothetical protein